MKIVIFSRNGTVTEEERAQILSKLPAGVEYNITERMEGDLESTAVFINEARCDLVVCAKDMVLSPWQLADRCADLSLDRKRPIFAIDGNAEEILDREFEQSSFSGTVGIVKRGPHALNGFKFEKAYGTANEHLPNTLATHFNIGSNTKMMTSIAVAKMIEDGHLQLDTPIHESLADIDCDMFYKKVFAAMPNTTPRQLLSHTSGLRDELGVIYEEDLGPQMIGFSRVRDYVEHFSSFDTELTLEEPKSFQYCNFGIDLLGLAIEAITGDYYQYVHDNVLKTAGMEDTVPLRQPGPTFAVPYLTPPSMPVAPILSNPEREKVLIGDVLTYAQIFSTYAQQIDLLIAEYHRGLLDRTPDEFSAFKMEMMRKIEPIFNVLKHPAHLDIIKRIEAVGISLHDDVMDMQKNDSKNPNLSDLRKLDEFLHDSYDYFSEKPLMGVLNSLSKASPSGRNMSSTVDDMLKFEEAINTGTLSSYNAHLTTNTAPFENNPSMRYGLGCFISGNHDDPEYTIAHGGYAPGMHSAFRSLPNLGYAVVALANSDESQQIMADRVQSHLIFGSKQTVFYFDLRIDPAVTQLLQSAIDERSLVSNLSHEAAFTEHTTEYRRNIDAMRGNDPDHIASNVSSDQEEGQEPEGSSVNPS